jgi:two-component system sensor histidine kinase YesM
MITGSPYPLSIRSRIRLMYALSLLPLVISALLVFNSMNTVVDLSGQLLQRNKVNEDIAGIVGEIESVLEEYLLLGTSEALEGYYRLRFDLENQISPTTNQELPLAHSAKGKVFVQLIRRYMAETDATVQDKRGRLVSRYREHFRSVQQMSETLHWFAVEESWRTSGVILQGLAEYSLWYSQVQILGYGILASFFLLGFLLLNTLSRRVTSPLAELAVQAKALRDGDWSRADFKPYKPSNEMVQVAAVFNEMKNSIHEAFQTREEKNRLEKELLTQNLENMEMQSLLKSSQLMALQTQVNPHFLFNTFNTGIQLAVIEDATKTADFLDHLAELFRFNLKDTGVTTTLRE